VFSLEGHTLVKEGIFVEYNNARLAEVGLSPQQLKSILEARNIIQSGGTITIGGEDISLEPTGSSLSTPFRGWSNTAPKIFQA
jgi:multidrug efflux pump subunit AcrB